MASPTLDAYLAQSRPLNPDYTDDEIIKEYEQEYGRNETASALIPFDQYLSKARTLNPEYSDDEIRTFWEEDHGSKGAPEVTPKELGLSGTLLEGAKSTGRSLQAAAQTYLGSDQDLVDTANAQQDAPKDPALEALLQDIQQRKDALGKDAGFLETAGAFGKAALSHPKGAGLLLAEQVPNTVASLGSAGAGALVGSAFGPVGTVAGGLAGLFLGDIALETGGYALEKAADGMVTPEERSAIKKEGLIKGGIVGAMDAATLGMTNFLTGTTARAVERATVKTLTDHGIDLANRAAVQAARSNPAILQAVQESATRAIAGVNTLGKKIARGTAALGVESLGEGAGEYLGHYAATGEADKMEAVIEAFAGLSQSAGEVAATSLYNKTRMTSIPQRLGVADPGVSLDETIARSQAVLDERTTLERLRREDTERRTEEQARLKEVDDAAIADQQAQRFAEEQARLQRTEAVTNRLSRAQTFGQAQMAENLATTDESAMQAIAERDRVQRARSEYAELPAPERTKSTPTDTPILAGREPAEEGLIQPGQAFTPRTQTDLPLKERLAQERARLIAMRDRRPLLPASPSEEQPNAHAVSTAEPLKSAIETGFAKAFPSARETRALVHESGFHLDTPVFREYLKQVTGKEVFSDLTPQELQKLHDALQKIKPTEQPSAAPQIPTQPVTLVEKPSAPVTTIPEAQVPRSELPPEQNAEVLLRAQKAQADMEIAGTERGGRFQLEQQGTGGTREVVGLKSPTADWYKDLTSGPSPAIRGDRKQSAREKIESAIQKIIQDQGADRGKAVELVKAALLQDREFHRTEWGRDLNSILEWEWPSWMEQPGQAQPSVEALHQLAESKGIPWDNNPEFMAFTKRVTGKEHLDDLSTEQRKLLAQAIEAQTETPPTTDLVLTAPRQARAKTKSKDTAKGAQTSIDVPPETIGSRPIIGREAQPEEAPLFSKAAQEPEAEQTALPPASTTRIMSMTEEEARATIDRLSALGEQRRNAAKDESIRALRPSGTDWLNADELEELNQAQTAIGRLERGAAQARVAQKRAAKTTPESPTGIIASALRSAADQIEGTLTDVGEKIGGARKDKWAERGLTLADLEGMTGGEEAKFIVKANIWKPDYAAMVSAGADPKAAALVKVIYDRLAAKPTKDTPEGRRHYLTMMGYVKDVLSAVETVEDAKKVQDRIFQEKLAWGDKGWKDEQKRATLHSVYKNNADPFRIDWKDQRKADKMVAEGFPAQEAWTRRYKVYQEHHPGNLTEHGASVYAKRVFESDDPWKTTFANEQELADRFKELGVWTVLEKSGKLVGYRATKAEAGTRAAEVYANKKTETSEEGNEPVRPHLDELTRMGEDYRQGRNVTAEDFRQAFGFRGVEFGNWAASDERQKHINQAYDGLMDLANTLDIPPQAISLHGTLGIAFGARGGGHAMAHYEPSKLVINITKINGPGAVAHEWGHALDHYFGEVDKPNAYQGAPTGISGWRGSHTNVRREHLRSEMRTAFQRVMSALFERDRTKAERVRDIELRLERSKIALAKAEAAKHETADWKKYILRLKDDVVGFGKMLTQTTGEERPAGGYGKVETSYVKEASALSGKTGDYWKRPTEMFARAFESYVFDKLGRQSQYLVHGVEPSRFATGYKGNPYPQGMERETINQAFDTLFETIESKETEKGVALFDEREYEERDGAGMEPSMEQFEQGIETGIPIGNTEWKLIDSSQQFPRAMMKQTAMRTYVRKVSDVVHKILQEVVPLLQRADKTFGDPTFIGLSPDDYYLGVNLRGPDQIIMNPWGALWTAQTHIRRGEITAAETQEATAAIMLETLIHELTHQQVVTNHTTGDPATPVFTRMLRLNHAILGADRLDRFQRQLMAVLTGGPDGSLAHIAKDLEAQLPFWNGENPLSGETGRSAPKPTRFFQRRHVVKDGTSGRAGPPTYLRSSSESASLSLDESSGLPGRSTGLDPLNLTSESLTYDIPELSKLDDVIRLVQDKNIDLVRLVDAIKTANGSIADDLNPVLKEELYLGRVMHQNENFLTDELKPLIQSMRLQKVSIKDLDTYLHARHAKEANTYLRSINEDRQDDTEFWAKPSGMTDAEAERILGSADPKMRSLADRVDKIVDGTRKTLVKYGLEKQETIDAWTHQYQHYVPLYREGKEQRMGTGQGRSVRGPASKQRTGSTRAVEDILAHIAMDREKAIVRGEKMRPVIALAGLLKKHPNPDIAKLAKPTTVTYTDTETGLEVTMPGQVGEYNVPTIAYKDPRTGQVARRPDPAYKGRDNVVNFRVDGEDRAIIFNEDNARAMEMARALKDLDVGDLNKLLSAVGTATRYLAAVNTQYNPIFGIVNFVRDAQFAMLSLSSTPLKGKQAQIVNNARKLMGGIYKDARAVRNGEHPTSDAAQLWERFQTVGGPTGYRDLFRTSKDRVHAIEKLMDPDWWQKTRGGKLLTAGGALKTPTSFLFSKFGKGVMEWLSDYNLTMENAMRLAVFKTGVDAGLSDEKAASLAKNITVNFNKKGQISAQAGALYAFFNASVQGTARLAETLFEPGKVGVLSAAGKKIVTGGVMLGILQAMWLAMAGFDDDEPPEFVKAKNFVFPNPLTDKGYGTLPMPLGFHVLPAFGRLATEAIIHGNPGKKSADFLSAVLDSFSPTGASASLVQTLAPTATDPLVALSENKDWTGKPIYREDFNKLRPTPGFQRAKDSATPWARGLSELLNYVSGGTDYTPGKFSPSPDAIDYLIGQATGGVGREVSKAARTATGLATGEEVPWHAVPGVGRFVGSAGDEAGVRSRFYDNLRRLNEEEAEIKGRREHGADWGSYLREHPEARYADAAQKVEREIAELTKRKREMVRRGANREMVKLIEQQIQARMTRINQLVER